MENVDVNVNELFSFEQCEDGMCKMFKSKGLERVQILRYIICSVALIKFINLYALVYPSIKWGNNNCLIGFKIRGYRNDKRLKKKLEDIGLLLTTSYHSGFFF